ncbi:MAG: terminase gpA endonuclease subunit [Desulfovibrio sp.]
MSAAPCLVPPPAPSDKVEVVEVDRALVHALGLPVPEPVQDRKNFFLRFSFSSTVRAAFRAPVGMRPAAWSEKYFIVTEGSRPGPWRNENAPYLAGIMDAWAEPYVRDVTFMAPPQVGKSKIGEILVGYIADRDPSLTQYVVPDETSAAELVDERLRPMFEESPRLSGLLTGAPKDLTAKRFKLRTMRVMLVWAGSVSRLAAKAAKYQIRDEVDKYPEAPSKKETSTEALLDKRQRTFRWDRKIYRDSSPTKESGPIFLAFSAASARFYFHVRCPLCGHMQRMYFTDPGGRPCVCWPKEETEADRIEDGLLAWYECSRCAGHWDDAKRDRAVSRGEWREEKTGMELFAYLRLHKPRRIAFHISALYSMFVSLSETAAAFLRSKGNKLALRDFCNGYLAEPWKDYAVERKEQAILALRDDRPRGLVPGGGVVSCLLASVDTQKDHFIYRIRAFGWGGDSTTWGIREGRVETFEEVERVLWQDEYKDPDGKSYPVRLAIMDSQGTRTAEVYEFCRKHVGKIFAFKGEQQMSVPHTFTVIDHFPNSPRKIPGGLKLLRGHVTYFKSLLSGKLAINPADPGAFLLHAETTEDYARQMCAEYYDDADGVWLCPDHKANHFWDCEVYCLIAADLLGVRHWKKPEDTPAASVVRHTPSTSRGGRSGSRPVPSAIARRRG